MWVKEHEIEPDEYLLADEYDSTLRVGKWASIAFTPNRYASLGFKDS
jgi:hypothetical protein